MSLKPELCESQVLVSWQPHQDFAICSQRGGCIFKQTANLEDLMALMVTDIYGLWFNFLESSILSSQLPK